VFLAFGSSISFRILSCSPRQSIFGIPVFMVKRIKTQVEVNGILPVKFSYRRDGAFVADLKGKFAESANLGRPSQPIFKSLTFSSKNFSAALLLSASRPEVQAKLPYAQIPIFTLNGRSVASSISNAPKAFNQPD
jgi:hypothetical protein